MNAPVESTPKITLKKYNTAMMPDIIAELEMSPALFEKVQECPGEMDVLNVLMDAKELDLAVKFLALGLPKKEAIWWSCVCVEAVDKNPDPNTVGAFKLVNDWARASTEEKRRAAKRISDVLGLYTPMGWVTTAIFWSGGSLAPEGKPPVEPPPMMCGHAVSNAVSMAAENTGDPAECLKRFLKKGIHIAMGGNGRVE